MKIAIVHPKIGFDAAKPTAVGFVIQELLTANQADTQTRIFSRWTRNPDTRFDLDMLPKPSASFYTNESALFAKRIRAFNPDIIEVHLIPRTAAYLARAFPNIPVVYYKHVADEPISSFKKDLRQAFRYCWLAHSISVSHFVHRALVELYPETTSRASVVHNALAADPWLCEERNKENIILFCGRTVPEKGIEPFIQAVADILPDHPDWRVVVLSSAVLSEEKKGFSSTQDYSQQQEALFKKKLGDRGTWITNAPREQIQAWLKKARIGIVPSDVDEAFSLSLLEMHFAGCAVISSGRGGMKEVSGPDGALYLKEVSGSAIKESLGVLINNPQERKALAERGHQYVMRHHNIRERAAQLDQLRREIVARALKERRKPKTWRRKVRREQWQVLRAKLFGRHKNR